MSKTARTLAVAGFIIVSTLPAAAQTSQPPTDEHVKALIAQAMQQTAQQPPAAPTPPVDAQAGPTVNLTEQEVVARAREKNLTLISERITPQTWDLHHGGDSRELPDEPDLGRSPTSRRFA